MFADKLLIQGRVCRTFDRGHDFPTRVHYSPLCSKMQCTRETIEKSILDTLFGSKARICSDFARLVPSPRQKENITRDP